MADNRSPRGTFGLLLGLLVAIAAIAFLATGGEHVGKKTVQRDDDLPPLDDVSVGMGTCRRRWRVLR